ncbi:MAG: hypothetical protein ABJ327_19865 [Litoreibacter sp.]
MGDKDVKPQAAGCEAKLREVLAELDECGELISAAYVGHAIDALVNKECS